MKHLLVVLGVHLLGLLEHALALSRRLGSLTLIHELEVVAEQLVHAIRTVLNVEGNTTLHHDVVEQLSGNETGHLGLRLPHSVEVHDERMAGVQFQSVVFSHFRHVHASRHLTALLHHLHHDSHRAGHLARDQSRRRCQSLRNSNFTNAVRKLVLQPQAESSHIFLRNPRLGHGVLRSQILLNLLKARLNTHELLPLIVSNLLEQDLIHIVRQHQNVQLAVLKRLHVR